MSLTNSPWPGIIEPVPVPERFGQNKSRNLVNFFYTNSNILMISRDPYVSLPVVNVYPRGERDVMRITGRGLFTYAEKRKAVCAGLFPASFTE